MKMMRTSLFWLAVVGLSLAFSFSACKKVELDLPKDPAQIERPSTLVLETNDGFKSSLGVVFVQEGVATGLKIRNTSMPIEKATWKIQGSSYEGTAVWHKFTGYGEINVKVTVTLMNGEIIEKTFQVTSVLDLGAEDPVKAFSSQNGGFLFLIKKERIRHASDTNFFYTGSVVDWSVKSIPIEDKSYIINSEGEPERVNDVGKFIGIKLSGSIPEGVEQTLALIHSGDNWTDLSGSAFVNQEDPFLMHFKVVSGEVVPVGTPQSLPGESGDEYFRFSQTGAKTTLFFRLKEVYTNTAFVVKELEGGGYSSPIQLLPVQEFPNWGKAEFSTEESGIWALRYGPDHNNEETYSTNMSKSFFYDTFFKAIRFSYISFQR